MVLKARLSCVCRFSAVPLGAALVLAVVFAAQPSLAQQRYTGGIEARPLVTQPIDEGKLMVLRGNTPAVANAKNDRGAVPDSMPVNELTLVLQRPPELEQALESQIDAMGRPGSPVYHKWLTAQQIGEQYGPSQQDVETTSQWLESQGFTLKGVLSSGMGIVFSGNAGQVKQAFHTELHYLDVDGKQHFANVSDPEIPAALAGLVVGVSKLNDFRPRPRPLPRMSSQPNPNPNSNQAPQPKFNETYDGRLLGPADVATIYNINPVHANGYTGAGQTIAVVGFSGLLHTTDITQFRSMFGLTGGSWTTVQVPGTYTCTDPGLTQLGYEDEAALDSEWAGAEAPGAAVELVACANLTAETEVQNLADLATPPQIITTSISDGCESQVGSAGLQFIVTVFQQAAAEGISIFDATSDSGADVCDQGLPAAVSGIQADSAASTPYDVAVGGLDFSDYYTASQGGAPESTYWSATNNSTTLGSALSYIPEMAWNSSCAGELIYKEHGYAQSYGSTGFCNTATAADNYLQNTYAGGGAPSSFSKQPAWQSALGVPTAAPASGSSSTNPRYLPDIAFFGGSAGDHAFAFCLTDNTGISSCSASSIVEGGGTSFTAPMMAGIQALINQAEGGGAQGNPNPIYYALAGTEYGSAGSSACNSSLGTSASSACIFYDVTLGDTDIPCASSLNCYGSENDSDPTPIYGALSVSDSTFEDVYTAGTGWDYASGLGSINVANLLANWNGVQTGTVVTPPTGPIGGNTFVTFTATVTPVIGSGVTGSVTWSANTGCAASPITAGQATCTTAALPSGSTTVTATYAGTGLNYGGPYFAASSGNYDAMVNAPITPTITWSLAPTIINGTSLANELGATPSCGACGTTTFTATPSEGSAASVTASSILATNTYTLTADFVATPGNGYGPASMNQQLAVSGESVWITDGSGGTSELAGNGYGITSSTPDPGANAVVAIDNAGNVWSAGSGPLLKETSQIGTVKNTISTGGGLSAPSAIAIDGASQLWVTNSGNSVSLFSNSGAPLSPSTGLTDSTLSNPAGIAVDLSGSVWVANKDGNSVTRILGVAAPAAPLATAGANDTVGTRP